VIAGDSASQDHVPVSCLQLYQGGGGCTRDFDRLCRRTHTHRHPHGRAPRRL